MLTEERDIVGPERLLMACVSGDSFWYHLKRGLPSLVALWGSLPSTHTNSAPKLGMWITHNKSPASVKTVAVTLAKNVSRETEGGLLLLFYVISCFVNLF